jgi:spore maturation protein CgeB
LERVKAFGPDVLLVMSGKTLSRGLLECVRDEAPGIRIANVFWDNPFFYDTAFSAMPAYDLFFVKDTYVLEETRKLGAANVRYLPQACYPSEHRPLTDLSPQEQAKYGSDLSFVGSMYPYRARILDAFADLDLRIWGSGFHGTIPRESVAYTKHQRESVSGRAKVAVFNATKVNLNTQNHQNDVFGVSSRVYQIAASGGFQLIDRKRDLGALFNVGHEVVAFRSRGELRELAEHYLAHPEERAVIAERSRQRAVGEHTFAHRWETILQSVHNESRRGP